MTRRIARSQTAMVAAGVLVCGLGVSVAAALDGHLVIFDFEGSVQEWMIPEWAQTSSDYACRSIAVSPDFVSSGKNSLQLMVDFPGGKWRGAYIEEVMHVTDWTPFQAIAVDVYVPYNAPPSLKARFILTVGEAWTWTEMNRGIALAPDQWTTVTANLLPGSLDWKFFPDEQFRKDIRKVGIRIESENAAYTGPVYVDQVRLLNQESPSS